MTDDSRTRFYLDPARGNWKGVCAGIADYVGIDVTWVRVGAIVLTLAGGTVRGRRTGALLAGGAH